MTKWKTDPELMRERTDEQLLEAWRRGNVEPGDPECGVITVEMQRRGLDFPKV